MAPHQPRPHSSKQSSPSEGNRGAGSADDVTGDESIRMSLVPTTIVRFWLPAGVKADTIALVGDFNDWSTDATMMERTSDGDFAVEVELQTGRAYRYRFLIDGDRWENDWNADYYAANGFGTDDSVRDLTPDTQGDVSTSMGRAG